MLQMMSTLLFARTMLIVGQKLMILRQITLNRVQNLPVLYENHENFTNLWVKHTNSSPYCRESKS